jgi:hypothetical protein
MKSFPVANFLNPVLKSLASRRIKQWDRNLVNLRATQESILFSHCQTAAQTEFGKRYNFEKIKSYADFKQALPLQSYAGFEPYLQRMRRGERDILWPGLISYYGQSSGTSATAAQHKFLPISGEQIKWQQKAAFDVVSRYLLLSGDRQFAGGYNLGLFPPSILIPEVPGVFTGSNPGIMFRKVPYLARLTTIPKLPIRDIENYDQKLEAIAQSYADYDVRAISGTTCWFSIFFDKLLKQTKASTVSEIWPNLRVLFGGGVNAEPYRVVIRQRMGKDIALMDNYNATEGGLFSVTDSFENPGLLMIPDRGVFFEFVRREDHGQENPKRFALWEVEAGIDYSIVLTTSSGLFGYYIGDFVRFISLYPHRMEFVGRPSGVLSITQELTTYVEIERAVAIAQERVACSIVDYSVASDIGVDGSGKGRYLFFVEFTQRPSSLSEFMKAVDQELMALNRVYREHRMHDVAILSPAIACLKAGSTHQIMEQLGFRSVQNKFPRIVDDKKRELIRQFVEKEPVS